MDIKICGKTVIHIPPHLSLVFTARKFIRELSLALVNRDLEQLRFAFWYLYRQLKLTWIVSETERKGLYDAAEHLTGMLEL